MTANLIPVPSCKKCGGIGIVSRYDADGEFHVYCGCCRVISAAPEPLYRIKPLVWSDYPEGGLDANAFGLSVFFSVTRGCWRWSRETSDGGSCGFSCESREAGKLAAESWYREQAMKLLEPAG